MRSTPRFLLSLSVGGTLLALPTSHLMARAENAPTTPAAPSAPSVPAVNPEAPKVDAPKTEGPKVEAPVVEPPKQEVPKVEAPKVDEPKTEAAPAPAASKAQDIQPAAPAAPATAPKAAPATPAPLPGQAKIMPGGAASLKPGAPNLDAESTGEELEFIRLVNVERAARGLSQLRLDPLLVKVARLHSAEMRDKKYFNHESPTATLKTPLDRYLQAVSLRPTYACVGENLFWSTAVDVKRGHEAFMKSPTHRENVLFPRYEKIGVGIVKDNRGEFWVTQMFLTNADPVSVAKNKTR